MDWIDRSEYPFNANFLVINGQQLHYIDEGTGPTVLFVHGTPSWSFDFRKIIKQLSASYRCLAIDHIGFGLSSKPKNYDYSPQNHSDTLTQFIKIKQLNDFTLVVHDFGGPIGLNFAIKHPEYVSKLVILNSWLWSSAQEPELIKLSKILRSPLLPFLYLYLNVSPKYLLPKSFGNQAIHKHIHRHYLLPFSHKSERYGLLAFAKSLLKDQDWFESLWQGKAAIDTKPTLLIWGLKDPFITEKYLQKFVAGFPTAHVCKLANSGHFPQEEEGETVAEAIYQFVKEPI